MDKDNVQAVLQWPVPQNLKQLRGFQGLTEYYKKFIKFDAVIAAPLIDLLKRINLYGDRMPTKLSPSSKLQLQKHQF